MSSSQVTRESERSRISGRKQSARDQQNVPAATGPELGHAVQRAQIDPSRLTPTDVMVLQRSIGNQAVVRLLGRSSPPPQSRQSPLVLQAKLKVGPVGDKYEQEADRVAQQVTSQFGKPVSETTSQIQSVQRQEMEEDELQMKSLAQRLPEQIQSVQRQEMEEDELQMKSLVQRLPEQIQSVQRQETEEDELQMKSLVQRLPEQIQSVQRQETEEDELQMKSLVQRLPEQIQSVQRQEMEEDELQMKPLVQRALTVGPADDQYEREADKISGNLQLSRIQRAMPVGPEGGALNLSSQYLPARSLRGFRIAAVNQSLPFFGAHGKAASFRRSWAGPPREMVGETATNFKPPPPKIAEKPLWIRYF